MSVAAAVWLIHLVALTSMFLFQAATEVMLAAAFVAVQALTIAVAFLLVTVAKVGSRSTYLLLLVQLIAGATTLYWNLATSPGVVLMGQTTAYRAWVLINLACIALLTFVLSRAVHRRPTHGNWLAFAGSLLGFFLWIEGLSPQPPVGLNVDFTQLFYALYLFIMWYLSKEPVIDARPPPVSSKLTSAAGFEMLSGLGPGSEDAARAVATERRRIAQDLHDNVGSQIVNILASLSSRGPEPPETVGLALEQCLFDLKMTVDVIDSGDDNVLEALGRVRQRIQRSLDAMGISMAWKVQICDQLEAARGLIAVQILRVAQESLTNVLRHSHATAVEVACIYEAGAGEIVLEIRDNGCGFEPRGRTAQQGKGLANIRKRAAALHGKLSISSKVGRGTRIRLSVPFDAERSRWGRNLRVNSH